jgi:N,N'-diacetyllegionaminate synthase
MTYIISEICGQWGGSIRRAEQMILQSKMGGADAVKVQLWDTHRMPGENRDLWEYLGMTFDQFRRLKEFSDSLNIDFFASAFHDDRFEWIEKLDIKTNKIASSLVRDNPALCNKMLNTGLDTFVSLGNWDKDVLPFDQENAKYFHCVAKYPHTLDVAIESMPEKFDRKLVGYSDHVIGVDACIEAVRRGATIIEKHFTTDKSLQSKTEGAHTCSMNYIDLCTLRNVVDKIV